VNRANGRLGGFRFLRQIRPMVSARHKDVRLLTPAATRVGLADCQSAIGPLAPAIPCAAWEAAQVSRWPACAAMGVVSRLKAALKRAHSRRYREAGRGSRTDGCLVFGYQCRAKAPTSGSGQSKAILCRTGLHQRGVVGSRCSHWPGLARPAGGTRITAGGGKNGKE
jgi:hypothetical protein